MSTTPPTSPTPSILRALLVVLRTEGSSHLRDRRSIVGALLFPALGPLILVMGFRLGIASEKSTDETIWVYGAEHAPELVSQLPNHGLEPISQSGGRAEAERAVADRSTLVALLVPENYATQLREGNVAELGLVWDSSRPKTAGILRRVETGLTNVLQTFSALRLLARGVSPTVAHPIRLRAIDLATPQQAAAKLLYVIPMMLMLSAFAGGMNIAIDATAGERERKSLEPLLLSAAPRLGILLGKWLTATLAATLVCGAGTFLFTLVPPLVPLQELGLRMEFGWPAALLTFVWLVPLAGFAVALEMLVASFARSFKEAQTYLSLLLLVPTLPALFLLYSPLDGVWWTSTVPALAQITALLGVLEGNAPPFAHLALVWTTSAIYCGGLLVAIERLWRRERIVFGR
jgi:sodium transport system permease protein